MPLTFARAYFGRTVGELFLDYARHIIHTQVTHIITERMVLVSGFVAKLPKSAFETISQCFQ